jgi:hypothetical protein
MFFLPAGLNDCRNLVNTEIKNIYENFDSSTCGLRDILKPQVERLMMLLNPVMIGFPVKSNFHPLGEKLNLMSPETDRFYRDLRLPTCGLRDTLTGPFHKNHQPLIQLNL